MVSFFEAKGEAFLVKTMKINSLDSKNLYGRSISWAGVTQHFSHLNINGYVKDYGVVNLFFFLLYFWAATGMKLRIQLSQVIIDPFILCGRGIGVLPCIVCIFCFTLIPRVSPLPVPSGAKNSGCVSLGKNPNPDF